MKVTIVSPNLSNNCLGRAYLLAELLDADYEVEIVGAMFGSGIWSPAATDRFRCRAVPGRLWPLFARSYARLVDLIDGDVILASKPLPTSYGAALASRARNPRPLVLDIDDDEVALAPGPPLHRPTAVAYDLLAPNGGRATRRLRTRVARADAVTVASRGLQAEFGGTLLPHAKDTDWLRPQPERREEAKAALGLAGRAVVMFLGSPHPWKGVHVAAAAMGLMRSDAVLAVVGADPDDAYAAELSRSPRVAIYPARPLTELPFVLEAADVVVIPQESRPEAARQLPSKLLDAMALAKPVVATAVGDMPRILADDRGVVVPPGRPDALARALDSVLAAPASAAAMGARARRWCEDHASHRALRSRLRDVIEGALAGARGERRG